MPERFQFDGAIPGAFTIRGRVENAQGQSEPSVVVRAFDRDMRGEERLGEAVTDDAGAFEITYMAEAFGRAEKKTADLVLRVFDLDGVPRALGRLEVDGSWRDDPTGPVFNVRADVRVLLPVLERATDAFSEYEQYMQDLRPVLDGVGFAELTADDVAFIVAELELASDEAIRIKWTRAAAKLDQPTSVPAEAFYGWARVTFPGRWHALPEAHEVDARRNLLQQILMRQEAYGWGRCGPSRRGTGTAALAGRYRTQSCRMSTRAA